VDRGHLPRQHVDFQKIKLRQRVAVNMENRSTASTMIGQQVAMPVALPPRWA
jgi:L-lactate dehydrogenase (cytochrome)